MLCTAAAGFLAHAIGRRCCGRNGLMLCRQMPALTREDGSALSKTGGLILRMRASACKTLASKAFLQESVFRFFFLAHACRGPQSCLNPKRPKPSSPRILALASSSGERVAKPRVAKPRSSVTSAPAPRAYATRRQVKIDEWGTIKARSKTTPSRVPAPGPVRRAQCLSRAGPSSETRSMFASRWHAHPG